MTAKGPVDGDHGAGGGLGHMFVSTSLEMPPRLIFEVLEVCRLHRVEALES